MIIWVTTLILVAIASLVYLRKKILSEGPSRSARQARGQDSSTGKRKAMTSVEQADVATASLTINHDDDDAESTPKVRPSDTNGTNIPAFHLEEPLTSDDTKSTPKTKETSSKSMGPPQAPKPGSVTGLMPPPSLSTRLAPPPSASSGLRVPSTGPLPDRSPDTQKKRALAANTAGKRNKVLLKPGHSPLDWANLTRSSANLAGVPGLQRVTPTMLKFHHGRKGRPAWASYKGKVYNITPYLPFHPGGEGELMRAAGKDGEKLFMEYHPWVNWDSMLGACLVGIMVSESAGEGLEDID